MFIAMHFGKPFISGKILSVISLKNMFKFFTVKQIYCFSPVQRRRWQIGLMDTLVSHWSMTFNPRYGMVGLFSMPYNWIFELFGAAIETIGYFLIPFSLIMAS